MFKSLFVTLSRLLLPLFAAAEESWVEGEHYDVINPAIRTAAPDKIEVAEFFWYGCGHCYTFEPLISQWKKTIPEDVGFRAIPAMWGGPMELHAKAFYAAQALGVSETMNQVMFQALKDHLNGDTGIQEVVICLLDRPQFNAFQTAMAALS